MRKNFTILVLVFSMLMTALGVKQGFSVSAYPYPVDVKQSNGSIIKILLQGDEKVKWGQTMDGYTIVYNKNGDFEYGMLDSKGDLVPSGYLVTDETNKSEETKSFLSKTTKGLSYSQDQVSMLLQIWEINEKEGSKAFPTTGSRKLICILIGFKDKAFTKTKADFENLFNQVGYSTGGATGSVKDYYLENSYGQFNLTVDVAGPYTASQNMSYYGANDASGNDVRPRELVLEAVNFADPTINFANYDNDNDGTVDGVYIIYAGYGEEAGGGANAIWAHAWNISPVVKDGKTISKYSCSAELRGSSGTTITAIGVICHEFGHVLGAPDYYDTNYATGGQFEGTGVWDMMASGSWNNNGVTPAHHNAFTKIYIYNWATATTLTSAANISVLNAAENKSFYRINTATTGEYFLMENREKHKFDAYLPGSGLIIYHVHSGVMTSASSNSINNTHQQRMYPKVASATTNPTSTPSSYGSVNSAGCPWPGSSNKTSFTDATTPHMKSWAGANTAKPMTNIVRDATAKTITFAFMGGGTSVTVPTVSTSSITSITTSSATGGGNVTATGGATVTARGICYSTSQNPTTANATVASGSGTGTFTANMTGLAAGTTYYVRAYATNSAGTAYGTQVSFTTQTNQTSLNLPVSQTFASTMPSGWSTQNTGTGITERWSMSNTANAGGSAYEAKCTYQNVNPGTTRLITPAINTVGVSQVTMTFRHMLDAYATGVTLRVQTSNDKTNWTNTSWSVATTSTNIAASTVTVNITSNLNSANTYFAIVAEGNLYQIDYWYVDNVNISASASASPPTVSTTAASSITSNSAVSGGNVTSAGSATVTERGICFSTSQSPTIANSKVVSGSGTGSFSANLTGLAASTTYYVRAYATSSAGTAYGTQVSFTTTASTVSYCASKGSNSTYEWIDLVQFAGINRTSGNDGGYKDMTSLTGTVVRGQTYPIYFSAGFQSTAYTEHWAIWIDYNKNGVFEDSEKVVTGSSSSSGTLSGNVTIPTTAVLGTTRMRVSMKYNAAQTACETFSYGEVEDYTVNITSSSSAPINFDNNAELLTNELIEPFLVYPNPASDRISIKTVGIEGNVTIKVYNTNGQIVRELISLDCVTNIDISDLAKGVYIISVDEEKEPIRKRFVKL